MDFAWTDDDARYRQEVREFLAQTLGPDWHGYDQSDPERYERQSKQFCAAMSERGWLTQNWPKEYGGQDASPWRHAILSEEVWPRGEPRGSQYMNVNWIGPAIMRYGTEQQKRYFLTRISRGDITWCQGFSEPGAGSDLAALRTRAVRDGDEYVVNGEKIWTSHTSIAEYMFVLVRTSTRQRKSDGITCLLVPVDTPGLEIRKVEGFVGESAFSNPVFTNMRVPVSARLGEEDKGWEIVRYALSFERVGVAHHQTAENTLNAIAEAANERGLGDDPLVQAKLGEAWAIVQAARMLYYRVVDLRAHDAPPSPDANISRVAGNMAHSAVADAAILVYGEDGLESGSGGDVRRSMAYSVTAGTTEIQLDQIATRYLRLKRL
jgi:alkylation response protein AidB-like acyl-CoA dehydrogenase